MKRWSTFVLLLLFAALPALGQAQTTATITGRVTDDQGVALAGATVSIRQTELGLERNATTNASGEYQFNLLPTGPYEVTMTADGKQPAFFTLRLGVAQIVPVNARLEPGGAVSEAITVTASASALETTTIGESFGSEQVEQLPIIERDLEDIALLSPNISFGPTAGTLAIAGAPSFDTRVLLDGAEVSDPYFGSAPPVYLEDAIEEVQVLTSGVSARYGRFQGGVINAITKSGGNSFEGSVRTELESEGWNDASPYGEELSDDVQKIYQGTLGGPILRDRLWFFGGLRKIPETTTIRPTTYVVDSITSTRAEERWQVKLRGAINASHMVDAGYLKYDATVGNYPTLNPGEARAVGLRADPRTTKTLTYNGVLNASTFIEVQGTEKDVQIRSGGAPNGHDPFIEYRTVTVFNNGWWDYSDPSIRSNKTLSASMTYAPPTGWFGGTQSFDFGFQRVASTTGGENRQSPTGLNFVAFNTSQLFYAGQANGEPTFNVITGEADRWTAIPLGGDQKLTNSALYLQTTSNFDRLRIDAGVRYERYDGEGPLPTYELDIAAWAPRLAATYSVKPNWQLQASYGRYTSRFNDNVANNVTGVSNGPSIVHTYTGPDILGATAAQIEALLRNESAWGLVTGYSGPDQPTIFQDENIRAPYADDINLSVRHALPRNTGSVVFTYVHRDYKQLLDDFQGEVCSRGFQFDLPCPVGDVVTIAAPTTGEVLGSLDTTVWANDPRAKRQYRALTLIWDYHPTTNWQVAGNYTYGKTKGNYEGEGQNTPSSGSQFGNYERSIDLAASTPFGYADDDIRHRVNVLSSYNFDFGRLGQLSLGSILAYQSGLPFSVAASVPLKPDPTYVSESGNYVYYFGKNGEVTDHARGSRRFNDWWQLDFSGRYNLPVYRDIRPFAKVSVLNLLNNHEVIKHQTSGRAVRDTNGNPTGWEPIGNCGLDSTPSESCTGFGRIRGSSDYQLPRSYQISLGVQF